MICDPAKIDDRGCLGAPDRIIEIISNANTQHKLQTKFSLYEDNRVREYWMIPLFTQSVQVFHYDATKSKYEFRKNYAEDDVVPVDISKILMLPL